MSTSHGGILDHRLARLRPGRGRQDQARPRAGHVRRRHRPEKAAVQRRLDGLLVRSQGDYDAYRQGRKNVLLPAQMQPAGGRQPGQKPLKGRRRFGLAGRRNAAWQTR